MNIVNRLEDLYNILQYCSDQQQVGRPACFSTLERILINQERGSLLSQLNQENQEPDKRHYKCPPKIESKIRFIIQKTIDINLITQ
ncbi:hypothetical protein [Flavobacterium laiguense]|uniref:Uncharacterized protein n=1 Tax=Flavobacterium laiguense TaxID=2169409 RepID=A0A2U1K0L9_9FLAO|nr:hypothetical protein [Flavobacterium laiguense]PWA10942.1 hypothetical protein DB891_03685 [Flavobacterium laiguense]